VRLNREYRAASREPFAIKREDGQIDAIAKSIEAFGFNAPILVDRNDQVLAGHGRLNAAKQLG
jgi:ParB-like chromosome segregation protein Spo0J